MEYKKEVKDEGREGREEEREEVRIGCLVRRSICIRRDRYLIFVA